ncbi:MAG: hypothetical protein NC319_04330 [Butyricicoccus sp.]|nr:hypothetical protein [Butyricicoccus sp.]
MKNISMMKKVLSILMAAAMMFALGANVLAADEADAAAHTVTIYVQEATRNEKGDVTSTYVYNQDSPIVVTVDDGQTLKDAINKACAQSGSVITNPVWKSTDNQYLISLNVLGAAYENYDTYEYDTPEVGKTTYEGLSWMYFIGAPEDMLASSYDYPDVSLGRAEVKSDVTFTLSYEYLTYVW